MKHFLLNRKTFFIFGSIFGLIIGITLITYANTYDSYEISYDTSTSGAVQANVKDALDFLYNKTKSGASAECPENMSCVEKPGVVMSVTGPGTVDKGTVYVGIGETNTFTVKGGNENEVLYSINCTNDYTVTGFSVMTNIEQTVTITNPNTANGATCTIIFGAKEISISSAGKYDQCNNNGVNCVCWLIKNGGSNFNYNGHTGCNFKSKSCTYTSGGGYFNCSNLNWVSGTYYGWNPYEQGMYGVRCSGVITCAT